MRAFGCCGSSAARQTASSGTTAQFKDWLRSKNVQFTEQEVPDMGHVWPLWRQNVTDMLPKLFQARAR